MYNHEPSDYICPFCHIIQRAAQSNSNHSETDVIYHSETVTAFLALGRWPKNPVDVLVVPSQHNESAGDQDVWHYHVHVTPRFNLDNFYCTSKIDFPETERLQ